MLFETPAGFALFKVKDEGKLSNVEVGGCSVAGLLSVPIHACLRCVHLFPVRLTALCFPFAGLVEGLRLTGASKEGKMIYVTYFHFGALFSVLSVYSC